LLTVIAIIALLISLLLPAAAGARKRARRVQCATNLRNVGQLIHSFVNAHDGYAAAVISQRDYYWDRGKQIGWDIETGRWASVPGGPQTIWQCPQSRFPYVGNARALGLDNREAIPDGRLHRVGPHRWFEPSRLAIVYDLQGNALELPGPPPYFAAARDPYAGDLSDEAWTSWPRGDPRPVINLYLPEAGPHDEAFGVLFGDGHVRVGRFRYEHEGVLWSGPKWWSDDVPRRPVEPRPKAAEEYSAARTQTMQGRVASQTS